MYPLVRATRVAAAALAGRRLDPLATSVLRMRVLPGDLDYNRHLNNGRYLTLMDLGRVDLIIRTGAMAVMRRHRWGGVVASLAIRYRRPLGAFQRFELHSRAIGWDDDWFFMEQRFESRGQVAALAVVKAVFVGRGGRVAPPEVMAAAGRSAISPPIPDAVRRWEEAEHEMQRGADG